METKELPFSVPAQAHSPTSIAAGESIKPTISALQKRLLDYLNEFPKGGATDEMMQFGLSMNPSTQRPRRIELLRMGLIVDSGLTRKTSSGRAATVWRIK